MKRIGDLVIYGTNGVCRVEDLREESFAGVARSYYILRPISDTGNSKIFVPADNEALLALMYKPLSAAELAKVIRSAPLLTDPEWPKDRRMRSKKCKEILSSGDRLRLISFVKTVQKSAVPPTVAEETACLRAATMLYEEFSLVFDLTPADMIPTILGETEPKRKE